MTTSVQLSLLPATDAVEISERSTGEDRHEWTITAGQYRAVIPECPCALRRELGTNRDTGKPTAVIALANCLCRSETCHNNQTKRLVCHGWHRARVERLADDVRKTLKKGPRR